MNNPTSLVFATNNKNKIREILPLLPGQMKLLSLEDIGCTEDIPETADTIEGNALLKARYVKKKYGYDCFADDTGLEVEQLGGAPGVYSARYAGEEKSSEANIEKLLKELNGELNRKANFKTVIALIIENEEYSFTGICEGQITKKKRGEDGFGYDPVFLPEGKAQTFAEMDLKEKSKISHRGRAVEKLLNFLKEKTKSTDPE